MRAALPSRHIIGSKGMGGAERWFVRFLRALRRHGEPAEAAVRADGQLARHHLEGIPVHPSPILTVWDPWSRHRLKRLLRTQGAPIVQTYMGRATHLTRLDPGSGQIHIARLGGFYRLGPFRHAHAWIGNTRALCDWLIGHGLPAELGVQTAAARRRRSDRTGVATGTDPRVPTRRTGVVPVA